MRGFFHSGSSSRLVAVALALTGVAGAGSLAAAGSSTTSAPVVSTFVALADTRAHEASPTTNYGSRAVLRVDKGAGSTIESFVRFSVSGIVGSVQRATLRLHATAGTVDGPSVAGTHDDWIESALTWNNRPGPTTGAVDDAGPVTAGAWLELDVTALVSGDGIYSLVLQGTSSDSVDFDSRESVTVDYRPELVVEALPSGAPVAIALPVISGSPQEGQVLAGTTGNWNGADPMTFARRWQRCDPSGEPCTDLPGETGESYLLAEPDIGATIRLAVTATNDEGSETATSAPFGPVLAAEDVVVAAAGDIASCSWDSDQATASLLDAIGPSHVLTLGDHVYPSGADADFAACYEPTWGRHKVKTHPSVGNHEYDTPGAAGYFGYFGAAAGDPSLGYYAFDLGVWRVYALNSNCSLVPCAPGSAQEQWLRADLAASPRMCVAAFMHHPRFSSGLHGSLPSVSGLWSALFDHGADLVLVGHDHGYERFTRLSPAGTIDLVGGIRSFVVGTGGAGLTPFNGIPVLGSEVRSATHGVLKLVLHEAGYDWAFVPVPGASFADAGHDTCNGAPEDATPPGIPGAPIATTAGAANVVLSWGAATDDVGVVAYDVFRDGQLLGRTPATSYTDGTALGGQTYAYHVTAVDAAANASAASPAVTVDVQPATATVVTLAAGADARILEAKPTLNTGTSASLRTEGGTDPETESYIRFAVPSLSGPVQRAVLRLFAYTATVDGPSVYGTTNDWTETGITWNSRPPWTTPAIDDRGAISAGTWVELDVTPLVTGSGTFSFALSTTSTDSVDFYSRNSKQTTLRPQLVLTVG